MTFRNRQKQSGQPWASRTGNAASGSDAGLWMTWMSRPSMVTVKWGNPAIVDSIAAQSKSVRQ